MKHDHDDQVHEPFALSYDPVDRSGDMGREVETHQDDAVGDWLRYDMASREENN